MHADTPPSQAVAELTKGVGVDAVLDTTGGPLFDEHLKSLRRDGRLALCGAHAGETTEVDLIDVFVRGLRILGFRLASPADIRTALRLVLDGTVEVPIARTFPLSEASQAQDFSTAESTSARSYSSGDPTVEGTPVTPPDRLDEVIAALRAALRGEVITPDHSSYDNARRVWNAMFDDRRPAAVLRCASERDVVEAVRLLRDLELPLAVRGGGHHIAGFGGCDRGFVIDLSAMRSATMAGDRVIVAGGSTLHEVDTATSSVGRAVPLGVVSPTGVAGLTLSGGVGWLTRRHGYTCDNLLSARVVTAAGDVVTAGEDENADLLWGLRGGGGNLG